MVLGELDGMGEAAGEALLGTLDPARNHRFRDRYVGLPLDLTGVLFVAVATNPGRIPPRRAFPAAGKLQVTGTVGPMTRVAVTWVRSHADRLSGAARLDDSTDVHVHLAEAARLKDGPRRRDGSAVASTSSGTQLTSG